MRIEAANKLNFNGIYKLKLTNSQNVNQSINKFITEHDFVMRKTKIFEEGNNNYLYVITSDGKMDETIFENDLREIKVPFWKSLSVNSLLNKSIVDSLFELTKNKQGRENWII